jgi:lipopolysaccharide/colanic/teichoic acid biosynthesis glycosyltransferase
VKRLLDVAIAVWALLLLAPLLAAVAVAVWLEDGESPWYRGVRVGRNGREFRMLKFRSMRPGAAQTGVNSTATGDTRVTRAGRFLRALKLDELPQLWNVVTGEMSLVGPRPQVPEHASIYTAEERRMLDVLPGITDLASIVFSDEGEILAGSADPDLLYNQIIRPWKSRLVLLYLERNCWLSDARILVWTAGALVSRRWALARVGNLLDKWGVGQPLYGIARRETPLLAFPPPGAHAVVAEYRAGTA